MPLAHRSRRRTACSHNKHKSAGGVARPASAGQHSRLVVARVQGECALYPVAAQPGVIVLPGLRNAGEPALVASFGRARARCTAKARRWRGAERVGEAGDAASLGWHESALARTHRRRARAGGSGRSALSPGRTSPSPFAPTTSATGLTLHYILTAIFRENLHYVKCPFYKKRNGKWQWEGQ